MITGIGVDTVDIARFERQLERTPALRARLFSPAERELRTASLAARFAAKEALIKAFGGSTGISWQDLSVERDADRAPSFVRTPGLARALAARGADSVHLSMTHDGGFATAFVVVEAAQIAPAAAQVAPAAAQEAQAAQAAPTASQTTTQNETERA